MINVVTCWNTTKSFHLNFCALYKLSFIRDNNPTNRADNSPRTTQINQIVSYFTTYCLSLFYIIYSMYCSKVYWIEGMRSLSADTYFNSIRHIVWICNSNINNSMSDKTRAGLTKVLWFSSWIAKFVKFCKSFIIKYMLILTCRNIIRDLTTMLEHI